MKIAMLVAMLLLAASSRVMAQSTVGILDIVTGSEDIEQ
jgi:hypothetical protein